MSGWPIRRDPLDHQPDPRAEGLPAPLLRFRPPAFSMGPMNGNDGDTPSVSSRLGAGARREPTLPPGLDSLAHCQAKGETLRVEGTNVVRVPFGVRRPRRGRPERPERWATLVLPFQSNGGPSPTPPQAA